MKRLAAILALLAAAPVPAQTVAAPVPAQTVAAPVPAQAVAVPAPGSGDARVQTVDYAADQVVLLQGAPGYQVSVAFAPDEHIESVALGDSGAWQATPNRRGDHLFVKPLQAGVSTNMTVLTDTRFYVFDLRALSGAQGDMPYSVRFRYPGTTAAPTPAAEPRAPGRYRVSGARAIRPIGIDDDGTRTLIEWSADGALPAVYTIDAGGKEALVNGNMRDGIYVIDAVLPRLVFRLDRQVARATRVQQPERR